MGYHFLDIYFPKFCPLHDFISDHLLLRHRCLCSHEMVVIGGTQFKQKHEFERMSHTLCSRRFFSVVILHCG